MIVIVSKKIVPKGYAAITLFPFVFVANEKYKENKALLNHEGIHLRQQAELLVVFFYIWYGIEFLIRKKEYLDRDTAYRNICFEREAYANERDLNYLTTRPFWNFKKYLKTKNPVD